MPYYHPWLIHRPALALHKRSKDLNMDVPAASLDLAHAPFTVIIGVLQSMSLTDRFTCALVCTTWAEAATAATRSIILRHSVEDLSCLERWLENHGQQLEILQLHERDRAAALTALPCPQLQDLLLVGTLHIHSKVWADIAAATKLTSVSMYNMFTKSELADVVSALTALPDLQQLTWIDISCGSQVDLSDSVLLQQMTKLTELQLEGFTAAAVEHLSALTKLQCLSIDVAKDWAAAGCPGLQELKALTSLQLWSVDEVPAGVSQLTALQQLYVASATPTALNKLPVLTGLTQLAVHDDLTLSAESPPLQLPGLQHLTLWGWREFMPQSFLASCTQLRGLTLWGFILVGPGSLVASTMLQQLVLDDCMVNAADGTAVPVSWQQVFSGPGQLPHLTALELQKRKQAVQDWKWPEADIERLMAACSNLQVLQLDTLSDSAVSALTRLSGLTGLSIWMGDDEQCRSLIQLTGLRELNLLGAEEVPAARLRPLTALGRLTSLGLDYSLPPKGMLKLEGLLSVDQPGCSYAIVNKAPAGHPPDVSAQLLWACSMLEAAGDS